MAKQKALDRYIEDNKILRDRNIKEGKQIAPEIVEKIKQLGGIGKPGTPFESFQAKLLEKYNISAAQIKNYVSKTTDVSKYYFSYSVNEIESHGKSDLLMEVILKKQETTTSDPEVKTMMMSWSNTATIRGILAELDVFYAGAKEILVDFKPALFLEDLAYFFVNEADLKVPLSTIKIEGMEGATPEKLLEAKEKRVVESAYTRATLNSAMMAVGAMPFKQLKDSINEEAEAKKKRAYDSQLQRLSHQLMMNNRDKKDHEKLKQADVVNKFFSSTKSAWTGVVNAVADKTTPSSSKAVEGKFGQDDD